MIQYDTQWNIIWYSTVYHFYRAGMRFRQPGAWPTGSRGQEEAWISIHFAPFYGSLYTFWMDTSDGSMVLLSVVKDARLR